jgi:putative transposase
VAPGSGKKGRCDAAGEAAAIAVEAAYPMAAVCRILDAPRSTVYHRRARGSDQRRPGPRTDIGDDQLLVAIRAVLEASPFSGEGYRKVRARLRRERGIHTSGKRVLRLMRRAGLLAPQRARRRRTPRPHDGTIIPAGPNQRWGADATMAWTRDDGWVWGVLLRRPLHGRGLGPCGQGG